MYHSGPSLREFLSITALSCTALHLAGGYLQEFTPHCEYSFDLVSVILTTILPVTRLAPQLTLTHLVLAEDSEIEWSEIHELLIAVSPRLESFTMRQSGSITSDESMDVEPFSKEDLPKLNRVVLALDGEILFALDQFVRLKLDSLELGSDDSGFASVLCSRLQGGSFPGLKELGFVSNSIEGVYAVCEERGISLSVGHNREGDFPL